MPSIDTNERYVATPAGSVYVKRWAPATGSTASDQSTKKYHGEKAE
ncbi:hypothetical protein HLV39_03605 [Marinobacter adhaerens]|uniref:Uncharacterized protein n=1 Tax=Marinobacter adhaerens TaxID=1033846 RepID=A0A851HNX3_9GAMM|nr:hypothetical protein [Marinobacter adhaerens]NWN90587.1 hypothetical protein [Marinobacter adhaerens]